MLMHSSGTVKFQLHIAYTATRTHTRKKRTVCGTWDHVIVPFVPLRGGGFDMKPEFSCDHWVQTSQICRHPRPDKGEGMRVLRVQYTFLLPDVSRREMKSVPSEMNK